MLAKQILTAIVAVDYNWAIGCKGQLLVKLPKDLAFFKEHSLNKNLILGSKTLKSFPKSLTLPERQHFVFTKEPDILRKSYIRLLNTDKSSSNRFFPFFVSGLDSLEISLLNYTKSNLSSNNPDNISNFLISVINKIFPLLSFDNILGNKDFLDDILILNNNLLIGGESIYKLLLDDCDFVLLTKINYIFSEADSYFPDLDSHLTFKILARWEKVMEDNGFSHQCFLYYNQNSALLPSLKKILKLLLDVWKPYLLETQWQFLNVFLVDDNFLYFLILSLIKYFVLSDNDRAEDKAGIENNMTDLIRKLIITYQQDFDNFFKT